MNFSIPRRWWGGRAYWLCQAGGWGGLIAGLTAAGIANDPGLYRRIWLLDWLALGASGLAASHVLRGMMFSRRERESGWLLVLWVLPRLGFAMAAMWAWRALLVVAIEPQPFDNPQWGNPVYIFETLILMATWTGFYFASDYYRRYEAGVRDRLRLDAALKEAELRALKSQINPHFLFNSLNTLRALIPREFERPREATTLLADLLRASLTIDQQETVSLADEMEIVGNYLALQQLRFESRLRVRQDISPNALAWPVPPFLIQSLMENAIKFGVSPREAGGEILLTAALCDDCLHLVITNPGRIDAASDSAGSGLKNARDRLHLLFGPDSGITLAQKDGDLVAAELVIPQPSRPGKK